MEIGLNLLNASFSEDMIVLNSLRLSEILELLLVL